MEGLGTGLMALAFWGFIGSIVVAGIWYGIRERQAQHETLRHFIDSGKPIDQELLDKVLGGERLVHRDLRTGGLIVIFTAPGIAILGWFVSKVAQGWLYPLSGVAALVALVGVGLLVAARAAERDYRNHNPPGRN
jgi:Domain of unknown function (DUF6249)